MPSAWSIAEPLWLIVGLALALGVIALLRLIPPAATVRTVSAIALRLGLIAALTLALAGLSAIQTTDRLTVVAAVDRSASIRTLASIAQQAPPGTEEPPPVRLGEDQRAIDWLDASLQGLGPDDRLGVVVFDGRATVAAMPSRDPLVAISLEHAASTGTDIASAIRAAASLLPADAAARLVVISDGNQTLGDALAAADEIQLPGRPVPIDVVPIEWALAEEVTVEAVDAPAFAPVGADAQLRVTLRSSAGARGDLRVFDGPDELDINGPAEGAARSIDLAPGATILTLPVPINNRRVHRFRAVFEPAISSDGQRQGDTVSANNSAEAITIAPGRGRILLLDGEGLGDPANPASALARALTAAGYDVDARAPSALPASLDALAEFDAIVLQNTSADDLPEAGDALIDRFVRSMGSGLVVVGGKRSYTPGGYRGTALQGLLPVDLDLPTRVLRPDAAIMIVLDRSGSMNRSVMGSVRTQQDIANESAAIAIARLEPTDLVGVIAFSNGYNVVVPLATNADPPATGQQVRGIRPGGGTNLGPALQAAGEALSRVDAAVKQIVVLSDGQSQNSEALPGLASRLAAGGIGVSCIAVGDGADTETMRAIAQAGNGQFYQVVQPDRLPRVFVSAVRVERSPHVLERPFEPALTAVDSPLTAGLAGPPVLGGIVLTRDRPDPRALVLMRGPDAAPLLAEWPVELGRVVAFTSDAWRWADAWLDWPGYARLWTQAVALVSRPAHPAGLAARAQITGQSMRIWLDALDESAAPMTDLSVQAEVFGPDGSTQRTPMTQTGPGTYESSVSASGAGGHVVVMRATREGRLVGSVVAAAIGARDAELAQSRSDRAMLEQIAQRTGGRVLALDSVADAGRLFDRSGRKAVRARLPMWRTLAWVALAVLMLDVAGRRIAWDRFLPTAADERALRSARATQGLGSIRERARLRSAEVRGGSAGLGEADAQTLAQRQEQERRARSLEEAQRVFASAAGAGVPARDRVEPSADQHGTTGQAPGPTSTEQDADSRAGTSASAQGLLRAKQRAAERFGKERP